MSVLWIKKVIPDNYSSLPYFSFYLNIFKELSFFPKFNLTKSLPRFWDCKDIKNSAYPKKKLLFSYPKFKNKSERLTPLLSGCKYTNFNF